MKPTTLCLIINDKHEILLGRKKRGFGAGKYNGFGGKKQDQETFRECAVREVFEEVSLVVKPDDLIPVGIMNFQFPYAEELNHLNYTYIIKNYDGLPMESEEMEPHWFAFEDIPFETMWQGDDTWIPEVLQGKLLHTLLIFGKDNDEVKLAENTYVDKIEEFETVADIMTCLRKETN